MKCPQMPCVDFRHVFVFANEISRISPQTVLTFCTNGVLLRTLMAGDECLKQVTHVIVVRHFKLQIIN